MHELSIAQSIADTAREHASLNGGRRVLRVGVRVGEISGVAVDALQFCFEMTVRGTDLDGAALELDPVPVRYRCAACGHEFHPVEFLADCPVCGSTGASMVAGDELGLSFLELE
jgi:hydrogenase nickel incorporation protein HypA/HybF